MFLSQSNFLLCAARRKIGAAHSQPEKYHFRRWRYIFMHYGYCAQKERAMRTEHLFRGYSLRFPLVRSALLAKQYKSQMENCAPLPLRLWLFGGVSRSDPEPSCWRIPFHSAGTTCNKCCAERAIVQMLLRNTSICLSLPLFSPYLSTFIK